MVLDNSLSVCAVSAAAERLLATRETEAVNHHITELLGPADAEAQGPRTSPSAVTWAARGDETPRAVTVRPANTFGVRLTARIAQLQPAAGGAARVRVDAPDRHSRRPSVRAADPCAGATAPVTNRPSCTAACEGCATGAYLVNSRI